MTSAHHSGGVGSVVGGAKVVSAEAAAAGGAGTGPSTFGGFRIPLTNQR